MFHENVRPKPPKYKPRPYPKLAGTDVPGYSADSLGHITREPNTQYNLQLFFYNQRKREDDENKSRELKNRLLDEATTAKYVKHFENKRFCRTLEDKVQTKMVEYDKKIEERRIKLSELLYKEERECTRQAIDEAQKANELKYQENEQKLKEMQEKKEAERLKIVEEKRMQQYIDRCTEFRPHIALQRCKEASEVQKLQMIENEVKKMNEKELEQFWHMMQERYSAAIAEREEQDKLNKLKRRNEELFWIETLKKNKIADEQQRQREKIQEKEELDKLLKEIEDEERAFAERALRSKKALFEDTQKQIKQREERLRRAAEEEKKIQNAYDLLTEELIKKEREKEKSSSSQAAKDRAESVVKYNMFVKEMKQQEQQMEQEIDELIAADMKEIQRRDDEKRCASLKASQDLQASVMKTRAKQVEEKKKHEEEMRKKAELEAELLHQSQNYYADMKEEYNRVKFLNEKKFQNYWKEQMAYSKILADRERENDKKVAESAKIEEKLYESIRKKVMDGETKISKTHPFKLQIEKEKCPCPKPNY